MPSGVYKHKRGYHRPPEVKEQISIKNSGSGNGNWKGGTSSYRSTHMWVETRLGKPRFCEHCGNRKLTHRQYHWANISKLYKRVLSDWIRLCVTCHKRFDSKNK